MMTTTDLPVHPDALPQIRALAAEVSRLDAARIDADHVYWSTHRLMHDAESEVLVRLEAKVKLPQLQQQVDQAELALARARRALETARAPLMREYTVASRAMLERAYGDFVPAVRAAFEAHQHLRAVREHVRQHGAPEGDLPPIFQPLLPETPTAMGTVAQYLRCAAEVGFHAAWAPPSEPDETASPV